MKNEELADAVVLHDGQVLLVRRNDVPVWTLPGGHVDAGETPEVSCAREVREETGLEVEIVERLGAYSRPWWLSGGRAAVFRCVRKGSHLRPGIHETDAAFWPVDRLPQPILYWYPAIIEAAARESPAVEERLLSPTLRGFLGSISRTPRLWLPLARHAVRMYVQSRLAQWHVRRKSA